MLSETTQRRLGSGTTGNTISVSRVSGMLGTAFERQLRKKYVATHQTLGTLMGNGMCGCGSNALPTTQRRISDMGSKRFPAPDGQAVVQYDCGLISHTWILFVRGGEATRYKLSLGDWFNSPGGWVVRRLDGGTHGAVIAVHPPSSRMFVAFKLPSTSWSDAEAMCRGQMSI